jgi:hypothetical protein
LHNIVLTNNIVIDVILSIIAFHALLLCNCVFKIVSAQEQIRLEAFTDQGTFRIQIIWTSNKIGSANAFEVHFEDPDTGEEIEDVKYDISIYREDKLEVQRLDQVLVFQEFSFEDMGSYEIRIDDVEDLGEHATIPIQVTPEFGLDQILLTAATIGAVLVIAVRSNNNNLFRSRV